MILVYHNVSNSVRTKYCVSVDAFARQMEYFQTYEVVHLSDYNPQNPRHMVLTFDDAYSDVVEYALPIMEKWNYPFELFIIGDYIGKTNSYDLGREPEMMCADIGQLRRAANSLARIQWHSRGHPRLGALAGDALLEQLEASSYLTDLFPAPHLRWLAYPYGDHTDEVVNLARSRFDGAVSVFAGSDSDRFQMNRVEITEDSKFFLSPDEKYMVVARLEKEIAEQHMRLASMQTILNSRSWRYTAPLRRLGDFLRRSKKIIPS